MKATELKSDGLSRSYEVTIPAKDLEQKVDAKLVKYSQTIRMPGFRPGKVPLQMMKQKHGRAVLGEVIEEAVQESTKKLLDDKNIRPAMQPKIEIDKDFDQGKDLKYTIAIETLPEFKVMDFKGVKLEKPVAKTEDSAIDEALTRIASQRRSSKVVEGKRATKKGDIVVIDFHGRLAGEEKPKDHSHTRHGMHAHGHHLELGSNSFIPGFEDQLVGKKAGEEVEVKVTFPENYASKDIAGKDAIFDVEINEIREPSEAKIDNEFAKSLGLDDLTALRKAVSEQLQKEYEGFSRMKLKKALLDVIDENHAFEVPAGMIAMENEQILRQIKMEQQQTGSTEELSEDEKAELLAIAERRVKLGLVLSDVGRKNNIVVSDAELQQAVIREAQKYPGQEKAVFDFYSKNRNALESLRAPLFEEKTVDFILELADVKEKSVSLEDLTAEEEEPQAAEKKKKAPAKKADAAKKDDKPADEKKPAAKKSPAKK